MTEGRDCRALLAMTPLDLSPKLDNGVYTQRLPRFARNDINEDDSGQARMTAKELDSRLTDFGNDGRKRLPRFARDDPIRFVTKARQWGLHTKIAALCSR